MEVVTIIMILGFVMASVGFPERPEEQVDSGRWTRLEPNPHKNNTNDIQEGEAIFRVDNGNEVNCTSPRIRSLNLRNQCLAHRKLKDPNFVQRFMTLKLFLEKKAFPLYESYFDPNIINKPCLSRSEERQFIDAWNRAALDKMLQERKMVVKKVRARLDKQSSIRESVTEETGSYLAIRSTPAAPAPRFGFSHLEDYLDHITNGILPGSKPSFTVVDEGEYRDQNHEITNAAQRGHADGPGMGTLHDGGRALPTDSIVDALIHQIQTVRDEQFQSVIEVSNEPNTEQNSSAEHSLKTASDFQSGGDIPNEFWKQSLNQRAAEEAEVHTQEKHKGLAAPKGDSGLREMDARNDDKFMNPQRQNMRFVRRRLLSIEEDTVTKEDLYNVKSPKVKPEHFKDFNGKELVSGMTVHRVSSSKGVKVLQYRRVVRRLVRRRVFKRILRPRYETVSVEKVIRTNRKTETSKSKKQEGSKPSASPSPSPTLIGQSDISVSVRNAMRNFVRLVMRGGIQAEGSTYNSNNTDSGLLSEERSIHAGIIVGPEVIHDQDMNTTGGPHTEAQKKREILPRADSTFEDNATLLDIPIQPRQKVQMRMSLILQSAALTNDMNDALISCLSKASATESTEWGAFDADRFTTELVHVDYFVHVSENKVESFVKTVDSYIRNGNLTYCMRDSASGIGFGTESSVFVGKTVYKPQDVEPDISEYGTPSWIVGVGIAVAAGAGVIALLVLTSQTQDLSQEDDISEPSADYTAWVGSPVVMVKERLTGEDEVDNGDEDEREKKEMGKIAGNHHVITLSSLPQ